MTVVIDPETGVSVTYGIVDDRYRVEIDGAVLIDTSDYRFSLPSDPAFWALALLTGETARDGETEATYRTWHGVSSALIDDLSTIVMEKERQEQ